MLAGQRIRDSASRYHLESKERASAMTITVGDFYEDLRIVLARGNTTDERLKVWARVALRFLEREFTFDYMRNTYFLRLAPGARYFDFSSAHAANIPQGD